MTTTDQELLELAAKAAGIELWHEDVFTNGLTQKVSNNGILCWNPLTDDGDALRLACDLGLNVYPVARTASGQACSAVGTHSQGRLSEVVDPSSIRAATRRAIVRAAAEIGKAMK